MIRVLYSCDCGIQDREVEVRLREPGEDVVHWVRDVVGAAVGADHAQHSPECRRTIMRELKIPVPAGTEMVGGPVLQ